MTMHKTGMSAIAHFFGDEIRVYDVGIACEKEYPGVISKKLGPGTADIAKGPAMSREKALAAIGIGIEAAAQAAAEGVSAVGIGEMGIGNTTTSAAVLAALTGLPAHEVTGYGSGLPSGGLAHKIEVIERALAVNAPDSGDPIDVISKVGGFDIAAMTGAFLGAALYRIPAVADGFISVVAALAAVRLCPAVKDHLFLSHASKERGCAAVYAELGLSPMLSLDMRLGEGSGCPLAFQIMRAACAAMSSMATFDEAAIDDGYLEELRKSGF
jgi:nicotinate-nucleotide--dimethylbenzimidazole phosphoribosyltransferase